MRYLPPNEDKELLQLALTIQETFLFGHYIYIYFKKMTLFITIKVAPDKNK